MVLEIEDGELGGDPIAGLRVAEALGPHRPQSGARGDHHPGNGAAGGSDDTMPSLVSEPSSARQGRSTA